MEPRKYKLLAKQCWSNKIPATLLIDYYQDKHPGGHRYYGGTCHSLGLILATAMSNQTPFSAIN